MATVVSFHAHPDDEALTRLPLPLFRLLLGREWFAEPGSAPGPRRTRIL